MTNYWLRRLAHVRLLFDTEHTAVLLFFYMMLLCKDIQPVFSCLPQQRAGCGAVETHPASGYPDVALLCVS